MQNQRELFNEQLQEAVRFQNRLLSTALNFTDNGEILTSPGTIGETPDKVNISIRVRATGSVQKRTGSSRSSSSSHRSTRHSRASPGEPDSDLPSVVSSPTL